MKKKRNKHKQIVNEKVMRVQQKNDFLRKFKRLLILVSDEHTYRLIPPAFLDIIYSHRAVAIRVLPASGHKVPESIIKDGKKILTEMMKETMLTLKDTKTKEKISLEEYFTIGVTIIRLHSGLEEHNFKAALEVKNNIRDKELLGDTNLDALDNLIDIMNIISILNGRIDKRVYWITFDSHYEMDGRRGYFQCFYIHSHVPEKIQVEIDKVIRPAFRLCCGLSDPQPELGTVSLTSEQLGMHWIKTNKSFDVYVQSHALARLSERLDNIYTGLLHVSLYFSVLEPKVYRDSNSTFFIEYHLGKKLAGYLPLIFYQDKIIIKTFLFLTNKGTPQGDKLLANTGLSVEDTKYLCINKLSAFMASDIKDNEKVKQIFIDAGCESLFDMDPEMIVDPEKNKTRPISMLIADYLGLNADDFDFEETEEEIVETPEPL